MEIDPYAVTGGDWRVDAWSIRRLPFEPKGWCRDYRSELQDALRSMQATATSVLYGEYAAPEPAFADLENVLLYNVGTGCYSHLARRGIVCRGIDSTDDLHHVTYVSTEAINVVLPTGPVLAAGRLVQMPAANTAACWWAAFRRHLHAHTDYQYDGEFGVLVEVGSAWRGGLALSAKPLLDGLVAALHVHDGSARDHVTEALGHLGTDERLWDLLTDPETAIFGRRRLVRPHGRNLAWNPADERCGHFALVRSTSQDAVTASVVAL